MDELNFTTFKQEKRKEFSTKPIDNGLSFSAFKARTGGEISNQAGESFSLTPRMVSTIDFSTGESLRTQTSTAPLIREGTGTIEMAGSLSKEIGQSIARNIGSAGLTIAGKIKEEAGEPLIAEDFQSFFGQALFETVFGKDEELKSIEQRIVEAEPKVKEWGQQLDELAKEPTLNKREKFIVETLGRFANSNPTALSFVGIMGSVGLDLTPFGGQDDVFKAMVKATSRGEAIELLTKMRVADDLIEEFADDVVKVSTTKDAERLLNSIAELQQATRPTRVVGEIAEQAIKPSMVDEAIDTFTNAPIREVSIAEIEVPIRGKPKQETIDSVVAEGVQRPVVLKREDEGFSIVDGANRLEGAKLRGDDTIRAVIEDEIPPIRRPPSVQRILGQEPPRKITRREDVLLRQRIKDEARGAKIGAREARKITKEELTTKFKDSQERIKDLRQGVMDYVKAKLPQEAQGKFLTALNEDLTRRRAFSLLERADRVAKDIEKSKEISAIKDLKLPKKGAPNIAVDYQKKISEVFTNIDVAKPSEKTLTQLKSLSQYLENNKEALNMNPELLNKVSRLSKKPLRDMSVAEVKEIRETLEHLQNLGKLKNALKNKYDARIASVNREKLIASTKNIDPKIKDPNDLTKAERLQVDIKNGYLNTIQTPRVADMLDGFKGYKGENVKLSKRIIRAETNARDTSMGLTNKFLEDLQARGITEVSEESQTKIAIDLMAKQGARDQVGELLKAHNLKEIPELTDDELFIANTMREYAGMHTQEIAAVAEEVKNVPFQKIDNYFPIKYERDFNVAPEDLINQQRHRTTRTPQGFTESRVKGVEKTPRIDVLAVLEEAMNEQQWFMHLQPELDDIKHLVLHPEYQEKAGDFASKFWRDYLDVVSRRGWSATAANNQFLRERRINLNNAILGYKVSTIVMQPMAVFDAMAYSASRFGPTTALTIANEMAKSWIRPSIAREALKGSAALRIRAGGEIAIAENLERTKKNQGLYNALKANAMKLIQYADQRTASGVQNGFQRILQRAGEPNWKEEAEFLMNLTQGSAEVSMRPLVLSKGEGARTWFTFQTFFLNRWGIVAHDLIRSGLFASKGAKQKLGALAGLGILTAGSIAENEIRGKIFELVRGEEADERSAWLQALLFIPEQVPYFGQVLGSAVDFGDANASPPLVRVVEDAFKGGTQIFTGESTESKLRGAVRLSRSIAASEFGIPGTYQLAEIANRFLQDERKAPSVGGLDFGFGGRSLQGIAPLDFGF